MKTYLAIIRDHSGSMSGIARYAARDFNGLATSLKEASHESSIDTIVSTIECGRRGYAATNGVRRDVVNSNINVLQPIPETGYVTDGGSTPLWDSVQEAINLLKAVPDYSDPEVTFVVMAITDGGENASRTQASTLRAEIHKLMDSDRWTFTFRVPKGYGREVASKLGLYEGNILEWDGRSGASMSQSTATTQAAVRTMYTQRKAGVKSTKTFYADMSSVSASDVAAVCTDISEKVVFYTVPPKDHDIEIASYIPIATGKPFVKGEAFYQLTKTEARVQDYKQLAIRSRKDGSVYAGDAARQMMGLPKYGDVRLVPQSTGDFDVYIQSTSLNRKLKSGTQVMVLPGATVNK